MYIYIHTYYICLCIYVYIYIYVCVYVLMYFIGVIGVARYNPLPKTLCPMAYALNPIWGMYLGDFGLKVSFGKGFEACNKDLSTGPTTCGV